MTYTFKLARRLAVSRTFGMLPAILLFAACGGDATAPENPTGPQGSVSVSPSNVMVETNQLIRFLAYGRNSAGDSVYAPIVWHTTGGTILPDGRFSSAAVGSFMVTGTTFDGGAQRVDTSMVKVVRRQPHLASIEIAPGTATLAPGVSQAFLVTGRLRDGRAVSVGVTWYATGGTIDAGGKFVAGDTAGTYQVIATHTSMTIADTATVTITAPPLPPVVPPAPVLTKVTLLPASATLAPSTTRQFTAKGTTATGDTIPVIVVFAATGGTIDAGGNYVAGDTAGTYWVTATNATSTLADTAIVTITAPPPPPPAPTPTLAQVTLLPASATLAPSTTRQFKAYGRTTTGDSVAVSVVFAATGGTVTAGGLFTAGSTAGTYRIIASTGALADTSTITVTRPLGSGPGFGIPFGPFNLWSTSYSSPVVDPAPFTMSINYTSASGIVTQINAARALGHKLVIGMTSGAHSQYITNGKFDLAKWKAVQNSFNTAEIKTAVAAGVADGTIVGNSVMDEPDHSTWGGVMTKPLLDQMGAYVKAMFPTLPVGVGFGGRSYYEWRSTERYAVLDFAMNNYFQSFAPDLADWKSKVLARAALDNMAVVFSLNILDGGLTLAGCPIGPTGGVGTFGTHCRMTATQVRDWGLAIGPAGCALLLWRYDATFMANAANAQAFKDIAASLATVPAKSCRRP